LDQLNLTPNIVPHRDPAAQAARITVMNALPRNDMSTDAFLANDRASSDDQSGPVEMSELTPSRLRDRHSENQLAR
jgi:hypothetical protein